MPEALAQVFVLGIAHHRVVGGEVDTQLPGALAREEVLGNAGGLLGGDLNLGLLLGIEDVVGEA